MLSALGASAKRGARPCWLERCWKPQTKLVTPYKARMKNNRTETYPSHFETGSPTEAQPTAEKVLGPVAVFDAPRAAALDGLGLRPGQSRLKTLVVSVGATQELLIGSYSSSHRRTSPRTDSQLVRDAVALIRLGSGCRPSLSRGPGGRGPE